ncbi:uncharacterized protein LOC132564026 [Ylistrum balloti]|uniref:uncharacterized protein LOC132564026 n=1 Tax=Ylistrum balloti TaxID=509963 RepID=UPI0029059044|nr:uncharacterized protein LOC132564026 [Ylistrum balloti]
MQKTGPPSTTRSSETAHQEQSLGQLVVSKLQIIPSRQLHPMRGAHTPLMFLDVVFIHKSLGACTKVLFNPDIHRKPIVIVKKYQKLKTKPTLAMDQVHDVPLPVQIRDKLTLIKLYLLGVCHILRKHIIYFLSVPEPIIRPSQPWTTDVGIDCLSLNWDRVERDDITHYEIRMKETGDNSWNKAIVPTENKRPFHRFSGLSQNTGYEFMSRAVYADGSTSEFSNKSVEVKTKCSELNTVLRLCQKIHDGPPSVYRLPSDESRSMRDEDQKIRMCTLGDSKCLQEKVILMIGPGEGGKTTLVNGLVNHNLGVKWKDDCRFKITDETGTPPNQRSHTEWITCYKLHPIMDNNDYILNIIDTPSLNDGPGSTNEELFERLKHFLSSGSTWGLNGRIDAICLVVQANPVQANSIDMALCDVSHSIASIFGVNMLENILPMLTFGDGKEPSVLSTLSTIGFPTVRHFVFNNSTLFPPYTEDALLGETLWQFRSKGFEDFLQHLQTMNPCPLKTTAAIPPSLEPKDQQKIMTEIQDNRLDMNVKLMDLATIKADRDTVKTYAVDIDLKKSFTYEEEVYQQEKIPLAPGTHVTNCIICHTTCHYPCQIPDNDGKIRCAAMKNGNCTVCHQKCVWHVHRNDTFRIDEKTVTVTRTYEGIKAKYKFDVKDDVSADAMLLAIKRAFVSLLEELISLISRTVKSSNTLQGIQQNEKDFIMRVIDSEEQEKKAGYEKRLELLHAIKNNTTVSVSDPNAWLKDMGFKNW